MSRCSGIRSRRSSPGTPIRSRVISPSTDAVALGRRHLDDPWSPLGRLMRDLGVSSLGQLSTMIPARPRSGTWPLVYRDLCEWAVLYDLICYERWGSDTLVVRDGLLRSHSRVIERYRLALAVEDVFPAGQPRYAQVPVELQVKVYDWPEYAWPPDDDRAGREKPKTNMGTMYLVRFGRQSHDPVWTVDLLHFHTARRVSRIAGLESCVGEAGGCGVTGEVPGRTNASRNCAGPLTERSPGARSRGNQRKCVQRRNALPRSRSRFPAPKVRI